MDDMTDHAALLARIADDVMANGGRLPMIWDVDPAMTGLRAELYPEYPGQPIEVRFTADWPGTALVCSRSLAGYSLEGGLHRLGQSPG